MGTRDLGSAGLGPTGPVLSPRAVTPQISKATPQCTCFPSPCLHGGPWAHQPLCQQLQGPCLSQSQLHPQGPAPCSHPSGRSCPAPELRIPTSLAASAVCHYLNDVGVVCSQCKVQGQGALSGKAEAFWGHLHVRCREEVGYHTDHQAEETGWQAGSWGPFPESGVFTGREVTVCDQGCVLGPRGPRTPESGRAPPSILLATRSLA